jgi:hypothetical protein
MPTWSSFPTNIDWHLDDPPVFHLPDDPTFDVTVPDICLQLRDPDTTHPPCPTGEDRATVEQAIRDAIEADFPGAYVDSACVGAGEPAGESAAFGIWVAPPAQLSQEQRDAMRAALSQPIGRAPGQSTAFFLSARCFERLADKAWATLPKQLDDKGIAQLDGPIHLTRLKVEMLPPATIVTTIDGYDERPLPDVSFSILIFEAFAREGLVISTKPVQRLEPNPGMNDILAGALLMASLTFTLWLLPLFALAVYQSVQIRRADAPDRGGVGSAVVERFMPTSIAVPGGNKRAIVYSGDVSVTYKGMFAGGSILGEQPRTPVVSLAGPTEIKAHMGQGTVFGHYRADVQDLRGPLVYTWNSDAEVLDSGPQVKVRFDPPPSGQARLNQVSVTVTDADGLVAGDSRQILVSTPSTQGPRGPGGHSGNPRSEP